MANKMETTVTGDVAKVEKPITIVSRIPDGKTVYGHPYFDIDMDKDPPEISNMFAGKEKYKAWKTVIKDQGIVKWANSNYLKSFYVNLKPHNIMLKIR